VVSLGPADWRSLNASWLKAAAAKYQGWTEPEHLVPRLSADFWFKPPDYGRLRH